MSGIPGTAVIQITNLSASVNSDQMRTLFGFLGDIEELRLYPPDNTPLSFSSKVCYIKYREPSSVGVAQHLTNTVFIDRALIVVPCAEGKIPEEAKALSLLAPAAPVASLMPGGGLLPIPTPAPLQNDTISFQLGLPLPARGPLAAGLESSVAALSAVPAQVPIMGNVDPSKVDEIRRTVYVGNLNSQTTTAEQLLEFFKQVGEVKFVRMAGDETQPTRFAFVEFANQESVSRALAFNGVMFGDRPLKINHSNNAIVKPPELTPQAAAKELEDVMKRVREAQSTIAAAIEPEHKNCSSSRSKRSKRSLSRSRSRSRSYSRKRSRSRHRGRPSQRSRLRMNDSRSSHKRHSRSRDRRPSRSRSRDRRKDRDGKTRKGDDGDDRRKDKKGRTPLKNYGRPHRSRSTSRGHKRRSRSRSRSPRKKAKSPSPKRGKKEKKRERVRDSSRERRRRSTSRKRGSRDYNMEEQKARTVKVEKQYEERDYESEAEGSDSAASEDLSPRAHHNGSYSSTHGEEEELSTTE
ncbi:splicing regulatory glutamine/lysine-rich protein 1 isoform X1 [Astyanax mexicanus]|uniref:Splicing regulatory glutamine/lysine-rich protein 1 n=1 Tax=Astyanax mexicanus TaxID=7994 RepID=A0A3B1K889_ASTMX|nr:splicing regulatory glutamine/lysine-rich protein 1 isoform X1 [Astyanax mexicanus]